MKFEFKSIATLSLGLLIFTSAQSMDNIKNAVMGKYAAAGLVTAGAVGGLTYAVKKGYIDGSSVANLFKKAPVTKDQLREAAFDAQVSSEQFKLLWLGMKEEDKNDIMTSLYQSKLQTKQEAEKKAQPKTQEQPKVEAQQNPEASKALVIYAGPKGEQNGVMARYVTPVWNKMYNLTCNKYTATIATLIFIYYWFNRDNNRYNNEPLKNKFVNYITSLFTSKKASTPSFVYPIKRITNHEIPLLEGEPFSNELINPTQK